MEITAYNPFHLGHVLLGDPAQHRQQVEHGVIGKPVVDELSVAPVCHQARAPHLLKMLRRVGDREPGPIGQNLDAAFALGELFQNLKTVGVRQRLGDRGELGEERQFGTAG